MKTRIFTSLLVLSNILTVSCFGNKKKVRPKVKPGNLHKVHDPVHVIVNKVGPFNNPMETYRYYSLPYCHVHGDEPEAEKPKTAIKARRDREGAETYRQRLGEHLVGDKKESSPFELTYGDNIEWMILCSKILQPEEIQKFHDAIHNNYFFEMFVEDLPMWGYIGEIVGEDELFGDVVEGGKTFLYPHLHFKLGMNKGHIVSATVSTNGDKKVDITDTTSPTAEPVKFSYSVEWVDEPQILWKDRMSRYVDNRFLPGGFEIHWLSIINAFVLVLLLTAFLTIIMMRVLRNDFSRYLDIDEESAEDEESGWKLIHGDVFRFPPNPEFFCACVGTGSQLLVATFLLLSLALSGVVSTTRRGSILSALIVLFCFTSFIGGFVSSKLYRQMNGKNWIHSAILTGTIFPVPVFVTFSYVNSVSLMHKSTSALPYHSILLVGALFLFLAFPLNVVGSIMGRNYGDNDFNAPTRTTKIAREIPTDVLWYKSRSFQLFVSGFLPFSAIYIEINYIFASIWGHQIYTLFGILFLAMVLLVIVTSFITVALLYFQLAREDHKWWWTVFWNGGSTGLFIFAYSIIYYFHRSEMKGILQGSFFFGYMFIISYGWFLMLGAASFGCSLAFVRNIYGRIKCE
mmetsp:Transcript_43322/g.63580  ORF Transcript_43322/g.63580 Transcript_43322/m.63580 type:complete len:628 (+) Transcript_43322:127-2010(+)